MTQMIARKGSVHY